MRPFRYWWCWSVAGVWALASAAAGQELGPLQTYGDDGRLYSRDKNEHYLLSRQSYVSEDSAGYQGQIRQVVNHEGGGYEVLTRGYVARCRAVDDRPSVTTYEQGREEETTSSAKIGNPNRVPSADLKNAYNLWWAACFEKFRKFR